MLDRGLDTELGAVAKHALDRTCMAYNVPRTAIRGKGQTHIVKSARCALAVFLKRGYGWSNKDIGRVMRRGARSVEKMLLEHDETLRTESSSEISSCREGS